MSQMATTLYTTLKGDRWIWVTLIFLGVASMLTVYSASTNLSYSIGSSSTEYYLIRQFIMIILGLGVTYVVHRIHFMHFWKATNLMYFIALGLLIYTIFFGIEINDAKRWIALPFVGITFQTSDLAKIALIMAVAKLLSMKMNQFGSELAMFLTVIGAILMIVLVIAPMDFSTAGMLFLACFSLLFVGNLKWKYIFAIVLFFLVGVLLVIAIGSFFPDSVRVSTWITRLTQFFGGGEEGFQVLCSKIAIANGGWYGVGPGNSSMAGILPSSYSDFIYAVISEEYGLIGAVFILFAYLFLLIRVSSIVTKCPHKFGALLAYGLVMLIMIQAFFNIAVSINLVPVTGLTLPMVSRGGTSTLLTSLAFGMILSVSNYTNKYIEEQKNIKENNSNGDSESTD